MMLGLERCRRQLLGAFELHCLEFCRVIAKSAQDGGSDLRRLHQGWHRSRLERGTADDKSHVAIVCIGAAMLGNLRTGGVDHTRIDSGYEVRRTAVRGRIL